MNKLAILAFAAVLGSALTIGVVMYRQLGSDSLTLTGTPELVANGSGSQCGQIAFDIGARSVGQWYFEVPKGSTLTGTVTVGGDESKDVGLRIWSPVNRIVLLEPDRKHVVDFEVVGTIRGAYRFDFDNRHSSFTDKQVTVALCLA